MNKLKKLLKKHKVTAYELHKNEIVKKTSIYEWLRDDNNQFHKHVNEFEKIKNYINKKVKK